MKKRLLLFVVLFLPFLFVQQKEVRADSNTKHGLVQKVEGDVTNQKGASFNKVPLGVSQKWRSGDIISTKKGASVEIHMPDTGDTFFVGENSEVYFTEKGENIFVHVLKGNVYVAAEKRESDTEALYIISGKQTYKVLGTHFVVHIDPMTGLPSMFVSSGIVASQNDNRGDTSIYPGQIHQPTFDAPLPIDASEFMDRADPAVIESILFNSRRIHDENRQFIDELRRGTSETPGFDDVTDEWLERLTGNLDALLAKIMNEAINSETVNEEDMRRIIDEINERSETQIDLDNPPRYEPDYSDAQQKAREEAERRRQILEKQRLEEQQRREQQEQRNRELLNRMEQQRKAQQERQEEARKKAEEEARRQLDEQRRPAPPPRPRPPSEPEPEPDEDIKELVVEEVGPFTIDVSWERLEGNYEYKFYLNGVLDGTISDSSEIYQFEDLVPGEGYDLAINAVDEAGKEIARYEKSGVETEKEGYEPIEVTATYAGQFLNVFIDNYDESKFDNYEIWINREKQDAPSIDENGCSIFILNGDINSIDVFGLNEYGVKFGYGRVEASEIGEIHPD